MTDVERYSQIVGATPKADASQSFGTMTPAEIEVAQLKRFISKVWIHEHLVPDAADELLRFEPESLRPELVRYAAAGGAAHLDGRAGGTLYETWALHQLFGKCRFSVLLCETAATQQPIDGIPRVGLLTPVELSTLLLRGLSTAGDGVPQGEAEITTLMNLGGWGHVIRITSRSAEFGTFYFWDSWPGPSLLCDANNQAGLRAQLARQDPVRWSIAQSEFESAVQAVVLPTRQLNGTNYGLPLISYAELKQTNMFQRLPLREVERAEAESGELANQVCRTRIMTYDVQLEFAINAGEFVQIAVIRTHLDLARAPKGDNYFGQLIWQVFTALGGETDPSALQQIRGCLMQTIMSHGPTMHVGPTLAIEFAVEDANGDTAICVRIAPA